MRSAAKCTGHSGSGRTGERETHIKLSCLRKVSGLKTTKRKIQNKFFFISILMTDRRQTNRTRFDDGDIFRTHKLLNKKKKLNLKLAKSEDGNEFN